MKKFEWIIVIIAITSLVGLVVLVTQQKPQTVEVVALATTSPSMKPTSTLPESTTTVITVTPDPEKGHWQTATSHAERYSRMTGTARAYLAMTWTIPPTTRVPATPTPTITGTLPTATATLTSTVTPTITLTRTPWSTSIPVVLIFPEKDAEYVTTAINFVWEPVLGAIEYTLEIADDITDVVLHKKRYKETDVFFEEFLYRGRLKWHVFAWDADGKKIGYSRYHRVQRWTSAPMLLSPKIKSTQRNSKITFRWRPVNEVVYYGLIIFPPDGSSAPVYKQIAEDQCKEDICGIYYRMQEVFGGTTRRYEWYVQAVYENGSFDQSETYYFYYSPAE